VHRAGYRYVTLDLDGFRSGNLNDTLGDSVAVAGPAPRSGSGSVPTVRHRA
jgi:hypothetical protein